MTAATNTATPPITTRRELIVMASILATATLATLAACSLVGQVDLSGKIWQLRLARLLTAGAVGSGLAVGGMALQALLRNPLAEPYLLGISSGAGVGVLLGQAFLSSMTLLPVWINTPALAFLGALTTCALVFFLARQRGGLDPYRLILSGVILNAFNAAIMLTILLYSDETRVAQFSIWMMGEVPVVGWHTGLAVGGGLILASWAGLFSRSASFNVLALGDEVAQSVGVSVGRLHIITFLLVSLMAGAAVALAGPIGFIGLIVPHILRMLLRADYRVLVLAAGFGGAIFLMIADTLANALAPIMNNAAIPVGILTALCGGPFFLILLRKRGAEVGT